jgi:hypothetical protein
MYVPGARERVQIAGRRGVFLVVSVDHTQQVADLIPLHQAMFVEENVPFSAIEGYREDLPFQMGYLAPEQLSE